MDLQMKYLIKGKANTQKMKGENTVSCKLPPKSAVHLHLHGLPGSIKGFTEAEFR